MKAIARTSALFTVLMTLATSAFAAGSAAQGSGLLVWLFLGFCGLIVATQLVPAAMLLEGHRGGTTTVAFRPNSTILASGGQDDLVRIWNAERPQDSPSRLSGVPSDILAVRWSADGSRLLSAHEQPMERRALNRSRRAGAQPARILHGTVLLWDWNLESATRLACKTVWANFERSEWERWIAPVSQREYAYTCPIE